MPVEIDVAQRLQTIADATLRIVAEDGVDGVTIRAVAQRVGGSTTLVTNYLPTRAALLGNALEHAVRNWGAEMEEALDGVPPHERLAVSTRWACSTGGDDVVLRRLLMEMLGREEPGSAALAVVRADARSGQETIAAAAADANAPDPAFVADVLHLVLRGFYLSSLEDPERWHEGRVVPVIDRLVGLLAAAPRPS
ncbi:hypothetical protein LO762_11185 [Actinocorallia sp. API 0066]|uniref:TetR/AcrR family transcriptional regulator n=1 Tax=Actinocorallia sp. API 0066 TaxID=2896846 RepID=UPI001E3A7164|nr:hypothetical protein [Actinocorallia sp. API 0066]MCD0449749.1 hypothetical protein [Actinocorallia sp. API 0066]